MKRITQDESGQRMSRDVLEYFFDPEELEPYYSQLVRAGTRTPTTRPQTAPQKASKVSTAIPTSPTAASDAVSRHSPDLRPSGPASADASTAASVPTDVLPPTGLIIEETQEDSRPIGTSSVPPLDSGNSAVEGSASARTSPDETANSSTQSSERVAAPRPSSTRTRVRRFISVHALGQATFCTRSGILALERGDERDPTEPMLRLGYLPCFERDKIEAKLKEKISDLGLAFVFGCCLFSLMLMAHLKQNMVYYYPTLILFSVCILWFGSLCSSIFQLVARRRAAIQAEAQETDPQVTGVQRVHWWSLLKAGFEPVTYNRPFQHPEIPLEGCPWRVLERGSLRIPVIRAGSRQLGDRAGELYPKHHVRLVAYGMLLESIHHWEVPFGVIFPCDSPHGYAVPLTAELRGWAMQVLERFEHQVRESQQYQQEPSVPKNRQRCAHCQHGFPLLISPREIRKLRKAETRLLVLQGNSGKTFHCECGDRFGTAPPHAKSIAIGLTSTLQ